jgi:chromosome segregation ATPase
MKRNKLIISALSGAIIITANIANAQFGSSLEPTGSANVGTRNVQTENSANRIDDEIKSKRQEIQNIRNEAKIKIRTEVETTKNQIRDLRAATTSSDKTKTELRKEAADLREQTREEVKKIKTETRENVREQRQIIKATIVKENLDKAIRRLKAAIERLDLIAKRIESRIKKFEEFGIEMTVPKEKMALAQSKLNEAKSKVEALPGVITGEEVLPETIVRLREMVADARDAIKEAHRLMVDAVNSMKPGLAALRAKIESGGGTTNTGTSGSANNNAD